MQRSDLRLKLVVPTGAVTRSVTAKWRDLLYSRAARNRVPHPEQTGVPDLCGFRRLGWKTKGLDTTRAHSARIRHSLTR